MSLALENPVVETGDRLGQLESWKIVGFTDLNTDRGKLYVSVADSGGSAQVSLYSDFARTALVAQGTGAVDSTVTLAEQGSSGLSGSVVAKSVAASAAITLWVALASDNDLIERDDRIKAMLLDDPVETTFAVIHQAVMRDFLLAMQSTFPPVPTFSDSLHAFGFAIPMGSGKKGRTNLEASFLWTTSGAGDFELTGLQNPGDYREYAIARSLFRIWSRKARGGEDIILTRAAIFEDEAKDRFREVEPWVDIDQDLSPDRQAKTTSMRMRRG